jgi:hypothetical protein
MCSAKSAAELQRPVSAPIPQYPRVAGFRDVHTFRARLRALGLALPCDDAPLPAPESPLAQALDRLLLFDCACRLGLIEDRERVYRERVEPFL